MVVDGVQPFTPPLLFEVITLPKTRRFLCGDQVRFPSKEAVIEFSVTFCGAAQDGWVNNGEDADDFCFSNIHDCAGECDGAAVIDDCGVCDGGNADELGCGCFEPAPSGCDNTCGSTLEFDECGVCGGDGIADGECDCDGNVDLGCGCGEV